ncbi:MAG: 1,4-alpha-glucan branching enzyme, partial [Alphaproteobacteria bacterium]|nr:1,4-alpha-glucan branching enzyme [Alphaproteobacteria bacterium]
MDVQKNSHIIEKIVSVGYHDPFAILGMHRDADSRHLEVRVFRPDARNIRVVNKQTGELTEMKRLHNQGFFVADFGQDAHCFPYKLHIESWDNGEYSIEDPYCFMPVIPDDDLLYFSQGNNEEIYRFLGAHIKEINGVKGTAFGVWAPNAKSVSVVGDFNAWDGRVHTMRTRGGSGVWEIFLPHVQSGDSYKYEIRGQHGNL